MASLNNTLTQSRLKELLHYDPLTGLFTRLIATSSSIKVGDIAGNKNDKGYIRISVDNISYKAHRLAWLYMTGEFPENEIDHEDHIRSNNRWHNLSHVTTQENRKNISLRSNNTSGVTGVNWSKASKKWCAEINVDKVKKYLGLFLNKQDAIKARKAAEIEYCFHKNHGT